MPGYNPPPRRGAPEHVVMSYYAQQECAREQAAISLAVRRKQQQCADLARLAGNEALARAIEAL